MQTLGCKKTKQNKKPSNNSSIWLWTSMHSNTDILIAHTTGKDFRRAVIMKKKSISGARHNDYMQLNVMTSWCKAHKLYQINYRITS